ncbi:MAG: multicopper oxidase domain-containing protein [bacterium]
MFTIPKPHPIIGALLVIFLIISASDQALAQSDAPSQAKLNLASQATSIAAGLRRVTPAQRQAAADRAAARRAATPDQNDQSDQSGIAPADALPAPAAPGPGGTPDYFNCPNWVNSPPLRKFVDSLPGLGPTNANNLGQYISVANPDTITYSGSDYYEINLVEYRERMHSDLPTSGVRLRGYVQTNYGTDHSGYNTLAPAPVHYLGPLIIARRDRPVRVKFANMLPTGSGGDLFIPVDTTVMGAGMGPKDMPGMPGMRENFTQNRGTLHLHGGNTPWISDGTPHQWVTPAGEMTQYPKGVSTQNVPDMPDPGPGAMTFFYTNQQSARLMFYHDHAYGITRLNVYSGEAAGYLLTDDVEQALITSGTIPSAQIPLIIQDKTFVPDSTIVAAKDPTWDPVKWGRFGDLWFPHVYMPNQNPADDAGVNAFGRWDYGPWFWPPLTTAAGLVHGPVMLPDGTLAPGTPDLSMVMEAFMDTPLVNGTAYPYLNVERKAYRFRILNACNDRFLNLQLYYADPAHPTEVKMVPSVPGTWPTGWPTPDGRDGGWPDPATTGPAIIQIGTEGGFLPAPVVLNNIPIGYDLDRRSITVLNVKEHNLFLGPAERADVVIDFSGVPDGSTITLYNDSPAPVPAFDPRIDYYTGNPDLTATGGAPSTVAGYGPNTRTIMQFGVSGATAAPRFNLAALQVALPAAYVASQDPPVVPQKTYPGPYDAKKNTYSRIQDTTITFTPVGSSTTVSLPMQPKAIQELFELDYGRMNSTLGVELPFTNIRTQTTIPFGFIDPPTENLKDGGTQIWKITHNGVDTHAIHVHLFNVQVINRVDWAGVVKPPDPNELGWKETVRMNPLEDCIVAFKPNAPTLPFGVPVSIRPLDPTNPLGSTTGFTNVDPVTGNPVTTTNTMTNFGWEYVWHCHLLGHEEMDMMRPMVFGVTTTRPAAPTGLAGSLVSGQIKLSWTDNSSNKEIGFRIERSTNGGAYTAIGTALANATNYTDTTANPSTTRYAYRVYAYNAAGDSLPSNTWSYTPLVLNSLRANVTFPVAAGTSMTWTASASGGIAPLQYQFWLYTTRTNSWSLLQGYGNANSVAWTPANGGTYNVMVYVRNAGSTNTYDVGQISPEFNITGAQLLTITSLTANVTFPVAAGTPIKWTATATGGTSPYQYQFWLYTERTNSWSLLQGYGASNNVTWTPVNAGSYNVRVYARNSGSTNAYDAGLISPAFNITGALPLTVTGLTANVPLPAPSGSPIKWTAAAAGGTSPYQYQFWLYTARTNSWSLLQGYGASNNVTWTPAYGGTYNIMVYVRNAGSTNAYDAAMTSPAFNITGPQLLTITSLTANVAFPAPKGTPITWTAAATGGTTPYQYQFWVYSASTNSWTMLQAYSASNTVIWTPTTAGTYNIQVRARNSGSTSAYDAAMTSPDSLIQ